MRSQVVITHYRCNQRCSYCVARRAEDDLAWIQAAAVRARVDAALAEGAEELVFTGGEPTQRGDLPSLVAYARSRGAREVALETNGTLLDDARAIALRDAGLARAVVNLSGWGDALDRVTADEGGFARTLVGIDALLAAGVRVELRAAVVRSTALWLPELPASVRARWPEGGPSLLWLTAPDRSPDATELIAPWEAAAVVAAVDAAARRVGLAVALAPDAPLTPCLFPSPSRVAHLFSLSRGGRARDDRVHLAVCEGCGVRAACGGFSREALARFGAPAGAAPVTEERTRRRLTLAGPVAQQVEREFVQRNLAVIPGTGRVVTEALVRVYFHCNQACSFCYVSTHLPPAGDARVREAIAAEAGAGHLVTLTGGEPTLHPKLVDFVRLARAHDVAGLGVALQTNAVRLDDAALTDALVAAGVTLVQVSLHAARAALSDAITQAPGTFARTLAGLDHLARHAAVTLVINYVIVRRNVGELGDFVELVAARWPRALVNVSFAALSTDVVPDDGDVMPRYGEVMPALEAALDRARALGLAVTGFASMCGVPLCLVSARHRPGEGDLGAIPEGWDAGEFVRGEACGACALRGRCYGLRRRYAERYGDGELRALV
jgi:MoaA/NifB/PqqE/SkfB family radical SAM enzyme